jgi:hypothetical protein
MAAGSAANVPTSTNSRPSQATEVVVCRAHADDSPSSAHNDATLPAFHRRRALDRVATLARTR